MIRQWEMKYNTHSSVYYSVESVSHSHRCVFGCLKPGHLYTNMKALSPFIKASMFVPKPRKDKSQRTVLKKGPK